MLLEMMEETGNLVGLGLLPQLRQIYRYEVEKNKHCPMKSEHTVVLLKWKSWTADTVCHEFVEEIYWVKKKKTCVKKATLRRSFLKEKAWWIRERRKSLAKLKSSRFWGTQSFSFIHEHSRGMGRPVQQSPSAIAKEARGSQAGLAFNSECLPPVLIQDKIPGSVLVSTKRPPGWGCLGSRNKQASTSCDTTERCLGSSKCWREFSSCKHSPCSAAALY